MSTTTLSPERLNKRLTRIFAQTFPQIPPDRIPQARRDEVEGWDSIGTLALVSGVEEDFDIKIGYDRIADLRSYDDVLQLLREKLG